MLLFIEWLLEPYAPAATVFILLLCVSLTLLTSFVNRLLSNPGQMKAWRQEIKKWTEDFKTAQKTKDKKLLAKVEKKKKKRFFQLPRT